MNDHRQTNRMPSRAEVTSDTKSPCKCGRAGSCSTCCCIGADHGRHPERPCSLCGHVGKSALLATR